MCHECNKPSPFSSLTPRGWSGEIPPRQSPLVLNRGRRHCMLVVLLSNLFLSGQKKCIIIYEARLTLVRRRVFFVCVLQRLWLAWAKVASVLFCLYDRPSLERLALIVSTSSSGGRLHHIHSDFPRNRRTRGVWAASQRRSHFPK